MMTNLDLIRRRNKKLKALIEFHGDNCFDTQLADSEWSELLRAMAQAHATIEELVRTIAKSEVDRP